MASQIKRKFILDNAVDGTKIQLENDQALRIKKQGGLDQDIFKLDTSDELQFQIEPRYDAPAATFTDADQLVNKAYVDAEIASTGGDVTAVQAELDATQVGAGLGTDGSYTAPVGSNYLGSAVSLKDADSILDTEIKTVADNLAQEIIDRIADVDAEQSARENEDLTFLKLDGSRPMTGNLDMNGASVVGVSTVSSSTGMPLFIDSPSSEVSINGALYVSSTSIEASHPLDMGTHAITNLQDPSNAQDAATKIYVDTAIANLVDGAPALLDTLNELAAAIGDDENFAVTITTGISNVQSELDDTQTGAGLDTDGSYIVPVGSNYLDASVSLADADIKLDAAIDSIEVGFVSEKIVLDATDIANGYIDLQHEAMAGSINAYVDRLAIHETDDYTLSVVGGVTRITFAGNLVTPSEEEVVENDVVHVKYAWLVNS
jgi:hypothetical protein